MASVLLTINRPSFGFLPGDPPSYISFNPLHEQSFRIKEIISNNFANSEYSLSYSDDLKNVYLDVRNNSEDNTQLLNYLNDPSSSIFTSIKALYENTDVTFKSEFVE
jgi:hypothetical protein